VDTIINHEPLQKFEKFLYVIYKHPKKIFSKTGPRQVKNIPVILPVKLPKNTITGSVI